jgi:phosphatidylglycerol:prolipoprotein diacylglycerol transferase
MEHPFIDPTAFSVGSIQVRWYGLMYLFGFVIGAIILHMELKRRGGPVPAEDGPNLILYAFLGVLLGGRLGYVLIYNPWHYAENPSEILAVWHGGMSFHGGLIGMVIAGVICSAVRKVSFLELCDLGTLPAPIALMLAKIGNFINGELYGRVTDVSWGVVFPHAGDLPRHPSQLYEAFVEGPILFAIIWPLRRRVTHHGEVFAVFLIGYGIVRFIVEFFRAPDPQIGFLFGWMTMGQILCSLMVIAGAGLLLWLKRRPPDMPIPHNEERAP